MQLINKRQRILVADDHALVRESICMLINSQTDMEVVAVASDGEQAWQQARQLKPDVIVMDVSMPKLSGVQATERLRGHPEIRVLAVSSFSDDEHVQQLLAAGAAGYLLKQSASVDLVNAVRTVAQGSVYIDANISGQVVAGYIKPEAAHDNASMLSPRETEVLTLIAYGYTNKEIAEKLCLSVKTIEAHKVRISGKMKLHTRADIVTYALRRGWLSCQ